MTTLGVGAIIGAGIFVITGTAAAQFAGPALVIQHNSTTMIPPGYGATVLDHGDMLIRRQ